MNPESRKMLPKLAFTGYTSRYEAPSIEEGFEDVTTVEFEVCGRELLARSLPVLTAIVPR